MDPTENISTSSEAGSPSFAGSDPQGPENSAPESTPSDNSGPTDNSAGGDAPDISPSNSGVTGTDASGAGYQPESDEVVDLDALESDMAAVEQAISTLDEISSRGVGGESAAKEIAAAVSKDRFGR